MSKDAKALGLTASLTGATVQLFGHVTLVQAYDLSTFAGGYALVALRDTPGKTVAALTTDTELLSLLATGLATGNLIYFIGEKLTAPPTPTGGTWAVEVYGTNQVAVYNMK
jgi:hypothetical protein